MFIRAYTMFRCLTSINSLRMACAVLTSTDASSMVAVSVFIPESYSRVINTISSFAQPPGEVTAISLEQSASGL